MEWLLFGGSVRVEMSLLVPALRLYPWRLRHAAVRQNMGESDTFSQIRTAYHARLQAYIIPFQKPKHQREDCTVEWCHGPRACDTPRRETKCDVLM